MIYCVKLSKKIKTVRRLPIYIYLYIHLSWTLENIRKRIQKNISSKLRKYFKRSKSLLTKPAFKLTSEQANEVSLMLELNDDLKLAYRSKELFYQYVLTQPNKICFLFFMCKWLIFTLKERLK